MPFGRRQAVLGEQVLVQERQLDGVGDLLDLVVEPADVAVGDVGHLLEQQVLDLRPGQLLEQQVRARVEAHRVAGAQVDAAHGVGQLADPLLVGAPDDERAHAVLHDLLDRHDLAGRLGPAGEDDVEALVEHDLAPPVEPVEVDLGVRRHLHLAAARQDVDGAVVVLADDDAVRRRRLGELVDLVAQRGDVLARLTQGVAELLVLGDGLGQLALGLEQPLLERAHPLRGVGEAGAQVGDLVVERVGLGAEGLAWSRRLDPARWPPSVAWCGRYTPVRHRRRHVRRAMRCFPVEHRVNSLASEFADERLEA